MTAAADTATLVRVLHAPRRREILRLCWDAECTAGAIRAAFPEVTFGAISQHLRILLDGGLVHVRRRGRERLYRARKTALGPLRRALENLWDSALYRLQLEAELEEARRGPKPTRRTESPT